MSGSSRRLRIAYLTFANPLPILRSTGAIRSRNASLFHSSRGAVAQLGERLNGIQEVVGSIPIGSTKSITCIPLKFSPFSNCPCSVIDWPLTRLFSP